MFLGRRKAGFTKEQAIKPRDIPNYVNEQNDTTFRRGESAPQAPDSPWIPPEPMPMHRLLSEFIRSQSETAQIVPRASLIEEDPETEALLEQIAGDPACGDIVALQGRKDTYYYSEQKMSRFVAWLTALVLEDDLPYTIAEVTRHNCVTYPAPTLLEYFSLSPFRYSQERIDEAMEVIRTDPAYGDIRLFVSEAGRPYLYSQEKMSERYALALSSNLDRAPVD